MYLYSYFVLIIEYKWDAYHIAYHMCIITDMHTNNYQSIPQVLMLPFLFFAYYRIWTQ